MTTQNAIVQTSYTIFDDFDNQLTPGEIYSVETDGPIVNSYISNGFLTIVPEVAPAQAEAPKVEEKKAAINTKSRAQETEAVNSQENANG
jgi:hypothetical protein